MKTIQLTTPFSEQKARSLKAGDSVLLSGTIYTARDAAHKRLCELLDQGEPLPLDLRDAIIYYVGPTPAKPGRPIGSAGPTTSYRMDAYAPRLLDIGLRGMIGKGSRNAQVIESIIKNGAVYFAAIGGAAALQATAVEKSEIVTYKDLGAEALQRLEVKNFPVTVVIDCEGNNLYEIGRAQYLQSLK